MTENITEKNITDQKNIQPEIFPFSTKKITFLTKNTTIFCLKYNNFRPKIYDFFGYKFNHFGQKYNYLFNQKYNCF